MKSKFTLWIILLVIFFLSITGLNVLLFIVIFSPENSDVIFPMIFISGFLIFTWIWLLFGEFRTKAIFLILDNDFVIVKKFCGLGNRNAIKYEDFDGYMTCLVPSKYDDYEFLYFMKDGNKSIKISQFYHKNYFELKTEITHKLKFIGKQEFSYRKEFREIFK